MGPGTEYNICLNRGGNKEKKEFGVVPADSADEDERGKKNGL